jgi:plastocyanin
LRYAQLQNLGRSQKTMKNYLSSGAICRLFSIILLMISPMLAQAATHDVMVRNNFFSPNNITIEVGDTVRWTNSSGFHDVTADDNSFASETSGGFTFSRTFSSIAEVLYYCTVHSSPGRNINTNMNGRINVVAASAATDVSVESVDAVDVSQKAGEDLSIKSTLRNTSAEDSGMFNINFYASFDATISAGDTLLGSKEISNVAAGASQDIDENFNLPESLAAGDYFIGAIIDLDDTNASNNTNLDETPVFVYTRFIMNAGLNDAWFNRVTAGQGFFITIFADLGFVSLAWFTYDTELPPLDATSNLGDPGHRWLTAGGLFAEDQAVMNIELTSGGLFDTATDIQRTDPEGSDGTLILTFDNCLSGTIEYDITSIDAKGTVPIQRVALDNVALCEALLRESQTAQ